jgi:hypothetical protein
MSSRTIAGSTSAFSQMSPAKNATITGKASRCACAGSRAGSCGRSIMATVTAPVIAMSVHASMSM